jgi:hypothetical protein
MRFVEGLYPIAGSVQKVLPLPTSGHKLNLSELYSCLENLRYTHQPFDPEMLLILPHPLKANEFTEG